MYQATQSIYNELRKDANLKVFIEETDTSSNAWLQFGIKNGGDYRIRFISEDDDNDVSVRVFSLVEVDESMRAKVLPIINEFNSKYRFVKFVLGSDGAINLEYDYLVRCPNPAVSAREIVIRIVKIIDDAYPELMRAMWA